MSDMKIRPYMPSDLPSFYAINQQSTPGVGHEDSAAGLARWIDLSVCLVAADESDAPLGFITLIEGGTMAYDSNNLRWCEANCADFIYVDRIALAETARGQRIGEALYRAAFDLYTDKHARIVCEVNKRPPNPGSMRFHERLGFKQIGERTYDEGRCAVVYYERML